MDLQKWVSVDCYFSGDNGVSVTDVARCSGCGKKCVYVCPAGLFKEHDGKLLFDSGGICLECGACRLACDNIIFDYPGAGGGIVHKFG